MIIRSFKLLLTFLALVVCSSCTRDNRAPSLHWRHLSNDQIKNLSFTEASLSGGATAFTGTGDMVTVKLVERNAQDEKEMEVSYQNMWRHAEALFQRFEAPYPGMISREKICPDKFRGTQLGPREGETETKAFVMQATSRMTLGVCNEEDGIYTALIGSVYCDKFKKMYDYKIYIGKNSSLKPLDIYMQFTCL